MLEHTLTEDLKGLSDFACRVIRFVTISGKDFVFLTVKQRDYNLRRFSVN